MLITIFYNKDHLIELTFVTVNLSFTNAFLSTTKSLFKFILPLHSDYFYVDSLFTTRCLYLLQHIFNTFPLVYC